MVLDRVGSHACYQLEASLHFFILVYDVATLEAKLEKATVAFEKKLEKQTTTTKKKTEGFETKIKKLQEKAKTSQDEKKAASASARCSLLRHHVVLEDAAGSHDCWI
jgi:uncharacterized protein YlxW (UPF0749 family)